jgi:hypothetical protein
MNSDPYGIYNIWLKSMRDGQEQMMKAGTSGMLDSSQAWKEWLEATMATWRKTTEMGTDPLGLTEQWLKMMERVQEKLLAGDIVPADPFTFFKEWYEAISDSWSRVIEDTIASEQFLEFNRQFLESYTSFSKAFRRANEEYLKILQLPSRSDVSHVGELVVALEEKFDQLEDRFEDVGDTVSQAAKSEAVAALGEHLVNVESQLNESMTGVGGRLDSVESKLDTLHGNLERYQTIEGLTQRLEQVESKLDRVLTQLAKIETYQVNDHDKPDVAAPKKAQKRKASQPEVNGDKSEAGS